MSIRNWSTIPIEAEIVKTICKNSFASAFNLEGIELYVSNSTASYQYDKERNLFVMKISGDIRYQLSLDIEQTFVANAPCIITIIWNHDIEPSPLGANRKGGQLFKTSTFSPFDTIWAGYALEAEFMTKK